MSKSKSIFISLPFTGKEDTLGERFKEACHLVETSEKFSEYTWIAQSNIDDLIEQKKSVDDSLYPTYMGKDIQKVLESDAILMCDGWETSKGCTLEYTAAKTFGIKIFYQTNKSEDKMQKNDLEISIINKGRHQLPKYETPQSAGMDIRANLPEEGSSIVLKPLERRLIPTGLHIALPVGYEAQVRPRSGLALKKGITVLNSPGTVDADYRNEIGVILVNLSSEDFVVNDGERIAQLVIAKHEHCQWNITDTLDETERKGGFGSTEMN